MVPDIYLGRTLTILYWDTTLGEWVIVLSMKLEGDPTLNHRMDEYLSLLRYWDQARNGGLGEWVTVMPEVMFWNSPYNIDLGGWTDLTPFADVGFDPSTNSVASVTANTTGTYILVVTP